jgi:hypothetical protein
MGLDNSIEIKRTAYTGTIPELKRFELSYDTEHKFNYEAVYYRKCWNVRSMVFDVVPGAHNNDLSDPLTTTDIDNIIEGLGSFNANNWQANGGSIWDWDDEEYPYSEKIQRDIENLKYLRELMDKYELEVYFYDSY